MNFKMSKESLGSFTFTGKGITLPKGELEGAVLSPERVVNFDGEVFTSTEGLSDDDLFSLRVEFNMVKNGVERKIFFSISQFMGMEVVTPAQGDIPASTKKMLKIVEESPEGKFPDNVTVQAVKPMTIADGTTSKFPTQYYPAFLEQETEIYKMEDLNDEERSDLVLKLFRNRALSKAIWSGTQRVSTEYAKFEPIKRVTLAI